MYDELVTALRGCVLSKPCDGCPYYDPNGPSEKCATMNIVAADAIEDLEFACNRYEKDYKDLCAYLPKWIPVTERLPENDNPVLCWYEYYHWSKEKVLPEYGIGYCTNEYWGGEVSNGRDCRVLFWMPLPTPPKEE